MGWDIPLIDLPDLPANPEQYIKDRVIELLNYLGYAWPTTEPGALRSAGSAWTGLQGSVDGWIADLEGGIRHLVANNSGPTADMVLGNLQDGESNLASLKSLSSAIPVIANGYGLAADVVIALRVAVIAEILLDVIMLAAAIVTGGVSAGASFLVKQGAGAVIDYLIDQAITQIIGGM
ncbi:hypothetical protein ACQB6R_00745 [Propionibacteriaceae bacterium G1746]